MIIKTVRVKSDKTNKEFDLEVYINISSMKLAEREIKKDYPKLNFITALPFIDTEVIIMTSIIGACCHLKGDVKALGSDWFDREFIDFVKYRNDLILAITECSEDLTSQKK